MRIVAISEVSYDIYGSPVSEDAGDLSFEIRDQRSEIRDQKDAKLT